MCSPIQQLFEHNIVKEIVKVEVTSLNLIKHFSDYMKIVHDYQKQKIENKLGITAC